jgi:hypothetical protein
VRHLHWLFFSSFLFSGLAVAKSKGRERRDAGWAEQNKRGTLSVSRRRRLLEEDMRLGEAVDKDNFEFLTENSTGPFQGREESQ